MEFTLVTTFALGALPPVLWWFYFWRRRLAEPEPNCVLFQLFFFGIFAFAPLMILREYLQTFGDATLVVSVGLIFLLALAEELVKGLALVGGVEANKSRFDKWEDGFEFAVAVALGFAFAENILYFLESWRMSAGTWEFAGLYLVRSFETMLGHMLFTGTFGYYYAYAYLARDVVPTRLRVGPLALVWRSVWGFVRRPFHITYEHILRGNRSRHGHAPAEILLEGLFVATTLHTLFNLLQAYTPNGWHLEFLAVPLLIGGTWWYATRWRRV